MVEILIGWNRNVISFIALIIEVIHLWLISTAVCGSSNLNWKCWNNSVFVKDVFFNIYVIFTKF